MLRAVILSLVTAVAAPLCAQQQGWPNLDALIYGTLTNSGRAEASFWLPDHPDPAQATRSVGIAYEHIPGSAGSVSIAVGYYIRSGQGWQMVAPVSGLFGNSPRDPIYTDGTMEVTTTMLGPNEPRCCPTLPVRWRIDLRTLVAQRLN